MPGLFLNCITSYGLRGAAVVIRETPRSLIAYPNFRIKQSLTKSISSISVSSSAKLGLKAPVHLSVLKLQCGNVCEVLWHQKDGWS